MINNPFLKSKSRWKNKSFDEKPKVDILRIYENLVRNKIRRTGRVITALCPLHEESHPSFTMYPNTNSFYCFSCGIGGDAFTLIMKIKNCDFKEALEIAKEYGQ